MQKINAQIQLSATDLVGHLNCGHLTALDLKVVSGDLQKPAHWDPLLEILRERGFRHEQAFIDHLKQAGLPSITIEGADITDVSVAATLAAMEQGTETIIQGALRHERWTGRADILRRVEKPSRLGSWSYEVIDTKLARETKGGTILQLCLYSYLLSEAQTCEPDFAYVVVPWSDFEPQRYRMADYGAYFRKAKAAIELDTDNNNRDVPYPDPIAHCDICRWYETCDKRRRDDDHLSFVAGISRNQITELQEHGVSTLATLAQIPLPIPWKPQRGAVQSFEKIREQARVQAEARTAGEPRYELLPVEPSLGLCALPEPSEGDIFFDLEGDPFVGEHGLEYLFGYHYREPDDTAVYVGDWAFDRAQEKEVFERFIDFVIERRKKFPNLHIYHFAPYEPAALKRLMGRYASRENEIDELLRGLVFVDLYSVVRNALRAGIESYSIKRLEQFYGYSRQVPLKEANLALASFQAGLELNDSASITDSDKEIVRGYNQDDCVSTEALYKWLEERRSELIAKGIDIPRPPRGQEAPSEELSEKQKRVSDLTEKLLHNIPIDPEARNEAQQAQWILGNILDWHRREEKAIWWEYFRLSDLSAEELMDERAALSQLTFTEAVPTTGKIPAHRYSFPQQDSDIRADKKLRQVGGEDLGTVVGMSTQNRTIDIKKTGKTADIHPRAVFVHDIIPAKEQAECLFRIGDYVVEHGIEGDGPYQTARDMLLRLPPRISGQSIQNDGEKPLNAAIRIAKNMESGVLPIQGPPGTGKSHTGARMICQFVAEGKKVGITANSHKVIRNLLNKVLEASGEMKIDLCCIQKPETGHQEENTATLKFAKNNDVLLSSLQSGDCQVAGATSFLWAREEAQDVLDVLVVDEAAQMSLANVLAISHAAKRLVLLGDPQQLDQPTQGTHPDGTGISSLEHILAGQQTITSEQGLFLSETWRMHPDICSFDSELFYEGKLHSILACSNQTILSDGPIKGAGLRYYPINHTGNKSSSIEEAAAIVQLVMTILRNNTRWVDRDGNESPLTMDDIIILTPYNAQVFEIQQRLPGVKVGTVDKFQGQEAPIAIYSMATSSHADAPRGMEFLYSTNRLNVAISRAKCLAILVASPSIFDPECRTPRQMQLANSFCRYLELCENINL